MSPPEPACTPAYDSHLWEWVDGHHVCVDCGAIDLDGERLMAEFTNRLRSPAAG